MTGHFADRNPGDPIWQTNGTGQRPNAHHHDQLQAPVVAARPGLGAPSHAASLVTGTPLKPWSSNSNSPTRTLHGAGAESLQTYSFAHDAVPQPNGASSEVGGTLPDRQAVPRDAGSATRTRIFDPARDLNPAQPSGSGKSPSSPSSTSSRTQIGGNAFNASGHNVVGQDSPSDATTPGSPFAAPRLQNQTDDANGRYQLGVIEHPMCARASTFGDRDRRVINPPPILKLSLKDYDPSNPEDLKRLTWAYNIVTCTLWRIPHQDAPMSDWVESTEWQPNSRRQQGGLMGSLVANPLIAESPNADYDDESDGPSACYYIFSDLSCRTIGLYRLRFALTRIGDDFYRQVGARSPTIAHAWTEPFEVFSAKDFPGVRASSRLLRYLKGKGANVTIKREKEGVSPDLGRKRSRVPAVDGETSPLTTSLDAKKSRTVTE